MRLEDERLLRGEGVYTADVAQAGALHAVFVRSPHAHARIAAIDTSAARASAGVVAVLTGEDLRDIGSIRPLVARKRADGSPMFTPPRPPLARGRVRFVGDPFALVLAENAAAAQDGADAVAADLQPLPAVVDVEAALVGGAPRVWDEIPDNACFVWEAGDADAAARAIASAAHVTRATIRVSRASANPLEPRGALASFDAGSGVYTLVAGVQSPWQARSLLAAQALGVSEDRLRVVAPDVGGSFGMKGQTYPEYAALLAASARTGRPVRWIAARSESLASDDHGRDCLMRGELALDADGRFLALRLECASALGAYLSTRGTLTAVDNIPGVTGVYRIPAGHARVTGVHANTSSISPYRGAGRPEAALLIERLVDLAARETGRDPAALRRLNTLRADELPWRTPFGFEYDSGDFPGCLERALERADHAGFEARRRESAARGRLRGFGLANVIARAMSGQFESASVRLSPDGSIEIATGGVSHGQGHASVFRRMAAQRLGAPVTDIRYASGDTALFDAAVGTFGSRTAGLAGAALASALDAFVEKALAAAALQMNTSADALSFGKGAIVAPGGASLSLSALAARAGEPLAAQARYAPQAATFPNGCHACEVEIDPETGVARVERYAVVEDVGVVLDHDIVRGQLIGGVAQGLGQALMEQVHYDPSGQLMSASFMDYAMPHASDVPGVETASHPQPTKANPLGVKGGGEGGTVGALPAIQNAIADALAHIGVRELPMPATPERIWRLIRDADKRSGSA